MQIEKCVMYVATQNPMTRINYSGKEGVRFVPISLPKLKCLENFQQDGKIKYFPYQEKPIAEIVRPAVVLREPPKELTVREKKAYDYYKAGAAIMDISREFRCSHNAVRMLIRKAQIKLGEL